MISNKTLSFSIIKCEKLIKKKKKSLNHWMRLFRIEDKFSQYGCQKQTFNINSTTSVPLFFTLVIGNSMKVIG